MVDVLMNDRACGCQGACHHGQFPLLRSLFEAPHIRERLHTICALYYYSGSQAIRRGLLARLEDLTYEVANLLAIDLLESGWRPDGHPANDAGDAHRSDVEALEWRQSGWGDSAPAEPTDASRGAPTRPSHLPR